MFKVIRTIYYILFFAVPLIVIPTTSELFELNKMALIYAGALLICCFGAIDVLLHGKKILRRTPLDIPILIFLSVMIVSTLFSIDKHTSIFGYYGRFNGGVLSMLAYTVLYYGVVQYFDKESVLRLIKVSVVSSFLVILWGLSGKLGHDLSCLVFTGHFDNSCWTDQFRPAERMFSTLGQPNWLGAYLAAEFYLGSYLYLTIAEKKISKWIASIPYGIYLVLNFACILFTRSRSALIAWAISACIFTAYFLINKKRKELKSFTAVGIGCLLIILLFKTGVSQIDKFLTLPALSKAPNSIMKVQRAASAQAPQLSSEVTESFDIRRIVWKGAWELGKRYPLFGTGPETFAYSYYFVRPHEHNLTSEWDYIYNKAHNEYLNYLATTGFTGLLSYLFLIVAILKILYSPFSIPHSKKSSADNLLMVCLACSFVTILVTNFFGFSTSTSQLLFFLVPAFAVASIKTDEKTSFRTLGFWEYVGLALVGVLGVAGLMWIILFLGADLQYSQGNARLQQGDYQAAAGNYSNALSLHHEHVYEDRLSSALSNIAFLTAYGNHPDTSKKFVILARYYIDDAIHQSPQNMLYWKTKGKNEYTFYQANPDKAYINEAIKALETAYKLAPTEPKLPYTLGLLYGALNEKESSLGYLNKTLALKPDYQDAYFLELKLLRAWKEDQKASELEKSMISKFPGLTKELIESQLKQ